MNFINSFIGTILLFTNFFSPNTSLETRENVVNNIISSPKIYNSTNNIIDLNLVSSMNIDGFESVNGHPFIEGFREVGGNVSDFKDFKHLSYLIKSSSNNLNNYIKQNGKIPDDLVDDVISSLKEDQPIIKLYNGKEIIIEGIYKNPFYDLTDVFTSTGTIFDGYQYNTDKLYSTKNKKTILDIDSDGNPEYTLQENENLISIENNFSGNSNNTLFTDNKEKIILGSIWDLYSQKNNISYNLSKVPFFSLSGNLSYIPGVEYTIYNYGTNKISSDITGFSISTQKLDGSDIREGIENNSCEIISNSIICDTSNRVANVVVGENLVDKTFIITPQNLNVSNGKSFPILSNGNQYLVISTNTINSFNESIPLNENDKDFVGLINMVVDGQPQDDFIIVTILSDGSKFYINKTKKVIYELRQINNSLVFTKYGNIEQINIPITSTGQINRVSLSISELENAITKRNGGEYKFNNTNIIGKKEYNAKKFEFNKSNSEKGLYIPLESFYLRRFSEITLNSLKENDLNYSNNPNTYSQFIFLENNSEPDGNTIISGDIEESYYPLIYGEDLYSVYGTRSDFSVFNEYSPLPEGLSYITIDGRKYIKFEKTGLDSFSNVKNYVRIVGWNSNLSVNISGQGISEVENEGNGLFSFKVEKGTTTSIIVNIIDIQNPSLNVSYNIPIITKGSLVSSPTDGSNSIGFLYGTSSLLYQNIQTNDKSNFFRINPYGYFDNPYEIFIREIKVKLTNKNSRDFYIEGIVSKPSKRINSTTINGGYDNIKTKIEGGNQVIEFTIKNFRGDIKGQNFLFKYNLRKIGEPEYDGEIIADVIIDYNIGRIQNYTISETLIDIGFGTGSTKKLTMNVSFGTNSYSQTYRNTIKIKVINNDQPDIKNSSVVLNFVNSKGINYPLLNKNNLENDSTDVNKFFNMVLDIQKNIIDPSKYDNQRIRGFYQGDNDLEGGGYGNGHQDANYPSSSEQTYRNSNGELVYKDNQYQYSTNLGFGSSHYFSDYSNTYWRGGTERCPNYYSYTPNKGGLTYGLISTIPQNVSYDTSIGKPNPMVDEMSIILYFDNIHKLWKKQNGEEYRIDMVTPAGEDWKNSGGNGEEYKKFPLYFLREDNSNSSLFSGVSKKEDQKWSIVINGDSPYISYDLGQEVNSNQYLSYENGTHIFLPSDFNGKVDKVEIQYMWDYKNPEKLESTIQGWYKHKNLIRITIKFKNGYSELYDWTKNRNEKLLRLVLPFSNPGFVGFTNETSSSGKQTEEIIPGLIKMNNYITGGGQLKYDVYFNAKQKYLTKIQKIRLYSWVEQEEIWRCGRGGCWFAGCRITSRGSRLLYNGTETIFFKNGYYYLPKIWQDGSYKDLNGNIHTKPYQSDYRYRDIISENWNPNNIYNDLGLFLQTKKDGKIDGPGYSEYLFKASGNYSLRFQNIYSPIKIKGNFILPISMSQSGGELKNEWKNILEFSTGSIKFLEDSDYNEIRKTIFEGNPKLNKPSIKNYFLNNSYNEINKVNGYLDDIIVSSLNNDSNGKIKVNYFGDKNLTIEKNILIDYENSKVKSYFDNGSSLQELELKDGMNVFITDGDVFINGDIIEKGYNKNIGIIIIAKRVMFGSKPQIFNGWIIAEDMGVEYNQKLFILNGGVTLKNGIWNLSCERMSTQKPEIALQEIEGNNNYSFNFTDTELKDETNAKKLYSVIGLSCTIINNGKYQMFVSKGEFLERIK